MFSNRHIVVPVLAIIRIVLFAHIVKRDVKKRKIP